jgi:hypothetical protein
MVPRRDAAALGIDLDARPSYAEVAQVRAGRVALVRGILDGLTDAGLERACTRAPRPATRRSPARSAVACGW